MVTVKSQHTTVLQEMKRNEKIAYDFGELLFKGTMMNILRVRMVTDPVGPDRSGLQGEMSCWEAAIVPVPQAKLASNGSSFGTALKQRLVN